MNAKYKLLDMRIEIIVLESIKRYRMQDDLTLGSALLSGMQLDIAYFCERWFSCTGNW